MTNIDRTLRWPLAAVLLALAAGCTSIIDKPTRPNLYDLGMVPPSAPAMPTQPPLVLADLDAAGALEGSAVLYRLGYADGQQLRAYSQARWTAPPPQLIRQRLREQLGRERVVLNLGESATLLREGGAPLLVLRAELEEFAHHFDSPTASSGQLRLRATLLESTPGGERLIAQRSFQVARPAATPDAPGGVRALTEAVDATAAEMSQWVRSLRPARS